MSVQPELDTSRDLANPEFYRSGDPEALWAQLRERSPVHWVERPDAPGFWAVTSHALVSRVLKDPAVFVSRHGMRLDGNPSATAASANKMLIVTDAPRHGKIRRIINSSFTPAMVRRLENTIRATAVHVVESALEAGECDLTEVASRLPVAVICDMLGVPEHDWDFMLARTRTAFGVSGTADQQDTAAVAAEQARRSEAHAEILLYYADLVQLRRRQPGEDIVTALVNGTVDGSPLSDVEIYLNCDGLVSGGNETTRHATVGGILALLDHPAQLARLREAPELPDTAVEEILRFTSPALHVLRTAAKDTELAGRAIRKGDPVTLWLPSANRDEEVFAQADHFDVERSPNRHLAFAAGPHYCLGASLAGLELRVMFDEIVRRVHAVRLRGPVRRLRSNLIRGYESVPVHLEGK